MMVIALMIASVFVPIIDWNDQFRTFLLGFILVFYAAKILPVVFLLLSDIVRIIDKLFVLAKKEGREKVEQEGISRSKFLQYLGYISGGLVLGTMFTGMFKWVYDFKIYDHKIKFPNLPSDFEGLKIVQISDIHLGSWNLKEPLEQAVEMINEMGADLVLFTGDLVNFSTQEA